MQDPLQSTPLPARVVLFMTHERPSDVPGDEQLLACLLPLGTASFAERLMDSCAMAGVRHLDVVVSEHPEALRDILQDGAPWGIQITWHHAKDCASPYKVLRSMAFQASQRIVIGHAHQWVASRIVRELLQDHGVALQMGSDLAWTGWFSTDATTLSSLGPHADYPSLDAHVRSLPGIRCVLATPAEQAQSLCAADLLAAQQHALDGSQEAAVPASWRRMPWGAASTDAVIHADALIHGPVLIGPGCVVEADAELGPGTVLAHDVLVASGAQVAHSLVMANTFVGSQVTLENALAQGNSVQSLKWSVRTVLSPSDAMLMPLRSGTTRSTPWLSRVAAAGAAAVMSPLLLPAFLVQRAFGGQALWHKAAAVQSRGRGQDQLSSVPVRLAHSDRAVDRYVAYFGGLLDIVQGRRCWFGMRPRLEAQWYALGRDWQTLFSRTPIGLFHAAAWTENNGNLDSEACAAADAFMAVQSSTAGRVKILYTHAWHNR